MLSSARPGLGPIKSASLQRSTPEVPSSCRSPCRERPCPAATPNDPRCGPRAGHVRLWQSRVGGKRCCCLRRSPAQIPAPVAVATWSQGIKCHRWRFASAPSDAPRVRRWELSRRLPRNWGRECMRMRFVHGLLHRAGASGVRRRRPCFYIDGQHEFDIARFLQQYDDELRYHEDEGDELGSDGVPFLYLPSQRSCATLRRAFSR